MTNLRLKLLLILFWGVLLSGCTSSYSSFLYYHPQSKSQEPTSLLAKIDEIEKKNFENIYVETLAVNQLSSYHLVVVRKEEALHYHASHDGWAMAMKGRGKFLLGGRTLDIQLGSSVFIPRGVPHKAISLGKEPLAAFVIFTPPYDGKDSVPVEAKNASKN